MARDDIAQQSLLDASCDQLIAANAPTVCADRVAVPVHPWQASYLREHPLVRDALASGRIQDLGTQGADFFPTSSIRTLYQPGNPYFYKLSLNIRITNCVRKNAWYELESAMHVNRVLRPLLPDLERLFPGLALMEEPAFLSVDFKHADVEMNRQVIEGFGLILRRSVDTLRAPDCVPLLAGSLFGNHYYGEARMQQLLTALAAQAATPLDAMTERWFSAYVAKLIYPVFHLFFAHGVIFEPHLQNVVLGLQQGMPTQLFLRDFEGVKLTPSRIPRLDAGTQRTCAGFAVVRRRPGLEPGGVLPVRQQPVRGHRPAGCRQADHDREAVVGRAPSPAYLPASLRQCGLGPSRQRIARRQPVPGQDQFQQPLLPACRPRLRLRACCQSHSLRLRGGSMAMTAPELRWTRVAAHLQDALAEGTAPLCTYVYDLEALRGHAAATARSLPAGFELFYAIKANSDLPILQTLAPLAHGFEISSGGELAWVREHFADVPLIFSGPGKTDAELASALDLGVEALHVESLHELERLALLARGRGVVAPVLLRVNLAVEGLQATTLMMGGRPTPFGIAGDQLPTCLAWLRAHPEIRLRGFHFHLMSHQLDAAAHLRLLGAYLRQVRHWRAEYGIDTLDQVNVGGGIGVNYREPEQQFDWTAFAEACRRCRRCATG